VLTAEVLLELQKIFSWSWKEFTDEAATTLSGSMFQILAAAATG